MHERNGTLRCRYLSNKMRKVLLIVPLLLLSACSNQSEGTSPSHTKATPERRVDLQLSSPDQSVKTWWKIRDLSEVADEKFCRKRQVDYKSSQDYEYVKAVSTGVVAASAEPLPYACKVKTFSRDIQEVKVESETRAVVLARIKATTPLPAGIALDSHESKWRDEGELYKYVLEKVGKEWKISQIYTFENRGNDPWKPVFEDTPKESAHSLVWGPQ